MLEPVSNWESTFNNLPKVSDGSWSQNFADAVDGLTTGKLEISNIKTVPASFVFGKAAFKSALDPLMPVNTAIEGATNFAGAWEAGLLASTMTVSVGASIGIPVPPTNVYGPLSSAGSPSPPSTLIDAPSIAAAKASLVIALTAIPPSADANAFASAFRSAFLALTCTTMGFDSTPYAPPGTVPIPLPNIAAPVA